MYSQQHQWSTRLILTLAELPLNPTLLLPRISSGGRFLRLWRRRRTWGRITKRDHPTPRLIIHLLGIHRHEIVATHGARIGGIIPPWLGVGPGNRRRVIWILWYVLLLLVEWVARIFPVAPPRVVVWWTSWAPSSGSVGVVFVRVYVVVSTGVAYTPNVSLASGNSNLLVMIPYHRSSSLCLVGEEEHRLILVYYSD